MNDMPYDPLEDPLPYCPTCYSALGTSEPQQCHHCRTYVSQPVEMTTEAFVDLELHGCPSCAKSIPTAAEVCPECGAEVDKSKAAPSLPQNLQMAFDFQTYEDSIIRIPLPANRGEPTINDVVERLNMGGVDVEIVSDDPAHPMGPEGRTKWEIEFLATLRGKEARESWGVDEYGEFYEVGDRFHMWLARTPARATDFDLLFDDITEEFRASVETSNWTLGISGHCSTEPAEDYRFHLTVARFAAGDDFPTIDETCQRLITAEQLPQLVQNRANLNDTYAKWTVPGDWSKWVHTTGVPRIGGLEFEIFDLDDDEVDRAYAMIDALVPSFAENEKPGPYRVHTHPEHGDYLWIAVDDARQFYPDDAVGFSEHDRMRLKFPSAVLVAEVFDPDRFAQIVDHFDARSAGPTQTTSASSTSGAGSSANDWAPPGSGSGAASQGQRQQHQQRRPAQSGPPARTGNSDIVIKENPPPAILAAIVSFFFPGVGQLILGQTAKGVSLLIVGFLTCNVFGLLSILTAVDAFIIGGKLERDETVRQWDFF